MIRDFFSLIYPRTCALCHNGLVRNETEICVRCLTRLPRFTDLLEIRPYLPNITGSYLYEYVFAYIKYYKKGIGQKLLQQIKYGNRPELAFYMGQLLGEKIRNSMIHPELIIPVPLHRKKLKKRGYNQSNFLARGISDVTGIPSSPEILIRTKNNPSQTNRSRVERILNVEGIFKVNDVAAVNGRKVLLADDVITTGATLAACAAALGRIGATVKGVACIALAR